MIPPVQPIPDPWYQRKAMQLQRIAVSQSMSGVGTEAPTSYEAPPPGEMKWGLLVGWGAVLAVGAGLFYAASQGWGTGRTVRANRRRSSRRRRSRRSTRRRATRRNSRRRTTRRKVTTSRRRRTRRNSRRRPLYWGYDRSRRMWFYDAPNGKRYYSKARTEEKAKRVAREAGVRTRRDDKRPELEFQQQFGMSRAEYGRKYLKRNAKGKSAGRRTTRNKELKKLMKKAREQGWTIVHSGGGHLKWKSPDKSQPIVVSGSTPSDHRSISNLKAQLRRSGLKA